MFILFIYTPFFSFLISCIALGCYSDFLIFAFDLVFSFLLGCYYLFFSRLTLFFIDWLITSLFLDSTLYYLCSFVLSSCIFFHIYLQGYGLRNFGSEGSLTSCYTIFMLSYFSFLFFPQFYLNLKHIYVFLRFTCRVYSAICLQSSFTRRINMHLT